jgi:hypothetical protein
VHFGSFSHLLQQHVCVLKKADAQVGGIPYYFANLQSTPTSIGDANRRNPVDVSCPSLSNEGVTLARWLLNDWEISLGRFNFKAHYSAYLKLLQSLIGQNFIVCDPPWGFSCPEATGWLLRPL